MLTFSITIDAGAILAKLARFEQLDGVEAALNDEADLLVTDEQTYPAEVPGSRYVRTQHLRDMTYHNPAQRSGNTFEVEVRSDAEYAGDVVGEDQKPAFAGRWRKFKKVAQDRKPRIAAAVRAAVLRSWGK
jgi:hypothetical protein